MKLTWTKVRFRTIFFRTFLPIFTVLFLIIGIYTIVLQQNSLTYLKTNADDFFAEQVMTRMVYLQNEMTTRWSSIEESAAKITEQVEQKAKQEGLSLAEIGNHSDFSQTLLQEITQNILLTLQSCGATDIFVVLDGQEEVNTTHTSPGIYLRNNNPESYTGNNQNILFERGMPSISKTWKFPLDTFWEANFTIDPKDPNDSFFTKPIEAARQHESANPKDFSYWNFGHPIKSSNLGVLTYSLPLIASDGTVFGVMGIGVSDSYFAKLINAKELGTQTTASGAYLFAKTLDGVTFEPVIFNGMMYNKTQFLNQTFTVSAPEAGGAEYLLAEGQTKSALRANKQMLTMYSHNTPFEQEQWYLIDIQNEQDLYDVYYTARHMLFILALSAIGLSLLGVYFTSRLLSNPISRLIDQLRQSDANRPIHLQRVKIEEVDELAVSIEVLSERVAAAFSKISTIIQMSESGIGVFEYKQEENLVFCSRTLYEMLEWTPIVDSNAYIDGTEFSKRLQELERFRLNSEPELLEIPQQSGGKKWFKLNQIQDDSSLLGVLTDVTSSILEKRQIEYERDFDILTNTYNRRGFEDRVQQLFEQPEALGHAVFIVWDLDNLKFVNDAYGHTLGDAYIIALAESLKRFDSKKVLSARRSGDEFVTFVYGNRSPEEALSIVSKIWEETKSASILLPSGNPYRVRVSAGIACYPTDSTQLNELFQYADFAMYTAKHNRKGTLESFDPSLYDENKILLQGQEEFHNLLEKRLIRYLLQPIISVANANIYGYEMLMRSTVEVFRSPLDILRMAHAQFKLYDVEVLTWFEAMKTFAQLNEYGLLAPNSKVFINSIANQVLKPDMAQLFARTYPSYLPRIVCEFTEEYQRNTQMMIAKTEMLQEWDAMIAIDDYGCGYNSESVLLEVSPHIVKIDMNIVRSIDTDGDRKHLVENLIAYAKKRGILVLGEGVETREEVETLVGLGVDLLQGYYFAKPSVNGALPNAAVLKELREMHQKHSSN